MSAPLLRPGAAAGPSARDGIANGLRGCVRSSRRWPTSATRPGTRPSSATANRCRCAPASRITLHASSHVPGPAGIDVVRITAATPPAAVPASTSVPSTPACRTELDLAEQPLRPGSWGEIVLDGVTVSDRAVVRRPCHGDETRASRRRRGRCSTATATSSSPWASRTADSSSPPAGTSGRSGTRPIEAGRWYRVDATISVDPFEIVVVVGGGAQSLAGARPAGARHPGRDDDRAGAGLGRHDRPGPARQGHGRVAPRRAPRRALARRRRDGAAVGPVAARCTPGGSSRSAGSVPTASCTSCRPVASPDRLGRLGAGVDDRSVPLRRRPLPLRRPLRRRLGRVRHGRPAVRPAERDLRLPGAGAARRGPGAVLRAAGTGRAHRGGGVPRADVHVHGVRQPPPAHRGSRLHRGPHPAAARARVRADPPRDRSLALRGPRRRQRRHVQLTAPAGPQPAARGGRLELHARHRCRRLPRVDAASATT